MSRRATAVALALMLLLSPTVLADWAMFGRDDHHSGVADITERSIDRRKPVVSWDRGDEDPDDCSGALECEEVISWGSVIGNFSANVVGNYDRSVRHLAWVTAGQQDDEWHGYLEIFDGGLPVGSNLMWRRDLGRLEDANGNSLDSDFGSFETAFATPALGDFNGNGRLDVAAVTTSGKLHFFEPRIRWYASSESYEGNGEAWTTWSNTTGLTVVRSNPAVTELDGGIDIVLSGLNQTTDKAVVMAFDGDGTRLWKFEADGTEVSSPVVLRQGSVARKVFFSAWDEGSLKVFGIWGSGASSGSPLSDWGGADGKNVGQAADPGDGNLHPLLPSLVLADLTADSGTEVLVPRPAPDDESDARLLVYKENGDAASGWAGGYAFDGGGDLDATPAVGDLDGDGDLDVVAVSWLDPGIGNGEETTVWAIGPDGVLLWKAEYDTSSSGGWDDDEHAIASPLLAVIDTVNGADNFDVLSCTTPECHVFSGPDGDPLWNVDLSIRNRDNSNRIFNSPAAADVDGDGLLDLVLDGGVWSADLADLVARDGDITITDEQGDSATEVVEGETLTFYPVTVRNEGNHDAQSVLVEVRLDDPANGTLLYNETLATLSANSVQTLESFDWTASIEGSYQVWVVCVAHPDTNEEVRYDNNNGSRSLTVRPEHGVELSAVDSTKNADSGGSATFSVILRNTGVANDNYTLDATLPDGWSGSWPANASNIASNATAELVVMVEVNASSTAGEHVVTLVAMLEDDANTSASLALKVNVSQYYGVALEMPVGAQRVLPDTWVSYPVQVTNTGNGPDVFDLYAFSDWSANIAVDGSPTSQITLNVGEIGVAELRVKAPADSGWNDMHNSSFTATSQSNSSANASVNASTSVGQLMALEPLRSALPGENASFPLQAMNLANTGDTLQLEVTEAPAGWELTLEPSSLPLAGRERGPAWLNLTVPHDATSGSSHELRLRASSGFGTDEVVLYAEVLPLSGLRLWPLEGTSDRYWLNGGQPVWLGLEVVNYETGTLEVTLANASLPADWSITYDGDPDWSKNVPAGASSSLNVTVTPPQDAPAAQTTWLQITASSGTLQARFDANLTVNQQFGLELALPDRFALLGNVSTAVKFNITNAGNGLDLLELNLSGDWVADEMQLLSLDPLETREIAVLANPGFVEAGTSSALSVSVRSLTAAEAGQTVAESGALTLIASGLLPASAEILELAPGESGSFLLGMVALHSDGTLRLELNGAAADWAVSDPVDDGNGFALPLGQPQLLLVNVTIPAGTTTGDYLLQVHGWDQAVPEAISEVNLTVRITRSWGLTLLLVSTPGALEPGTQGIWLLDIGNSGNGADTVNLAVEGLPADWTAVFSPQPASVAADNSKAVTLRLTLPTGAAAGEHNFSVRADSAGANTTLPLNLTVTAQYALEVNLTREAEQTGAPGDIIYYSFLVLNSGNSNDTALAQVSGNMHSQGNGQLDWAVKTLDASASADNVLRVTVPAGSGPWTATLTVKSQADPALVATFELTLRSQAVPDVQLAELEMYPSQPQAGDSVQVSVTVISIDADLDSVYVSIWLDGQQIHGEWVNGLTANYYDKELTVSFTAKSGSHVLQVVADPDNAVVESVETNNELEHHFSVEAEGSGLLPLYLVLVALTVVGGAVYYRYRNRERKPSLPKQLGPTLTEQTVKFPLVLNCQQCGSRVRVPRPGAFRCPACKIVARVEPDGSVVEPDAPRAEAPAEPPVEDPTEPLAEAPASPPQVDAPVDTPVPEATTPSSESSTRMAAFFGDASPPPQPPRDTRPRDERLSELHPVQPMESPLAPEPEPEPPAVPEPVEVAAEPESAVAELEPKNDKPKKKGPRDFGPSIGGLG